MNSGEDNITPIDNMDPEDSEGEHLNALTDTSNNSEDEDFVYPSPTPGVESVISPGSRQVHASPPQLESLYAAASSGDLPLLKTLFRKALENSEIEPFSLSNDASPRTGLTALHAASSRGYYDMTVWRESYLL